MDVRRVLRRDQAAGGQPGERGFQTVDFAKRSPVDLENKTDALWFCGKIMDGSCSDDQKIAGTEHIGVVRTDCRIGARQGTQNFHIVMPVRRIVFAFIIDIKADVGVGFVMNGFPGANQSFNHEDTPVIKSVG